MTIKQVLFEVAAAEENSDGIAIAKGGNNIAATTKMTYGEAITVGDYAVAVSNALGAQATALGDYSMAIAGDEDSIAKAVGIESVAISRDSNGKAEVYGKESIAISTGFNGKVKGSLGSYIAAAEWINKGYKYILSCFKTALVDGDFIKADTYYQIKNGEFVECNDNEEEVVND